MQKKEDKKLAKKQDLRTCVEIIKESIQSNLIKGHGRKPENASDEEMFKAVALSLRDIILDRWTKADEQIKARGQKKLYYLSAEFLMGRALVNNMVNLSLLDDYKAALFGAWVSF